MNPIHPKELILWAVLLERWERAERLKRTGIATTEEFDVLSKFFDIQRLPTLTAPFFRIQLSDASRRFYSALSAAKGDDNAIQRAIRTIDVDKIGQTDSESPKPC